MKLGDKLSMYYNEEVRRAGDAGLHLAACGSKRCGGCARRLAGGGRPRNPRLHPDPAALRCALRLLQLKCWLLPGEEEERRKQLEEEQKSAAPPILAHSASQASVAASEGSAAGPPGGPPSLARRSGVASRYAAAGGFGAGPSASGSEAGGGGSVLGGLRPAAAAFGGGAPAMFKPPSGVFTPAAPEEVRRGHPLLLQLFAQGCRGSAGVRVSAAAAAPCKAPNCGACQLPDLANAPAPLLQLRLLLSSCYGAAAGGCAFQHPLKVCCAHVHCRARRSRRARLGQWPTLARLRRSAAAPPAAALAAAPARPPPPRPRPRLRRGRRRWSRRLQGVPPLPQHRSAPTRWMWAPCSWPGRRSSSWGWSTRRREGSRSARHTPRCTDSTPAARCVAGGAGAGQRVLGCMGRLPACWQGWRRPLPGWHISRGGKGSSSKGSSWCSPALLDALLLPAPACSMPPKRSRPCCRTPRVAPPWRWAGAGGCRCCCCSCGLRLCRPA